MDEITLYLIAAGVLLLIGFAWLVFTDRRRRKNGFLETVGEGLSEIVDAVV